MMKKIVFFLLAAFVAVMDLSARSAVKLAYEVTPDTVGHYLNVTLTCTDTGAQAEPFTLKMPVWAPGYYVIVDFPKYLTDFRATDADGHQVTWTKQGKNAWQITPNGKTTKVSYRIFANERSVAECRVESQMAFVAPNGVFMYVDGQKDQPVEVTYTMPTNWKHISTGLKTLGENRGSTQTFVAANADVLYDSPVLLGNHTVMRFDHEGHAYEFALETPQGIGQTTFESDFKAMVSATSRMMGHVPYDNYCLIHLGEGQGGLEHLNSQACYTDGSYTFKDRDEYLNHLSFTTHEYFHLYNVKCIRPIELGPFDYDREVFTTLLWLSEGFTSYYETRLLMDAGVASPEYHLKSISDFINTIETHEGHKHMSLRQSSYDIWLNFFNRAANGRDVRISYYEKGPILGLLFDIDIRRKTNGAKSLDDLMRLLYNRFYLEQHRGFTEEEFWQACEDVAGEPLTLMRRYVDTTDEIDYDEILASAGLKIDHTTWQIGYMEKPTKAQMKLQKEMGLK